MKYDRLVILDYLDRLYDVYGDDPELFIEKAEEAGFLPDELRDYLPDENLDCDF